VSHAGRCALFCLVAVVPVSAADPVAATVNGEVITVAEVETVATQSADKRLSPVEQRQLRADVLNLLIDEKLVRQFLKTNGPKVDPAEVEKQYAALEAAQKGMGKSIDDYLKETGQTPAQVRENLRMMLQLTRYLEAQATDERLRQYYELTRDLFDGTTVRASHIVIRTGPTTPTEDRRKAVEKLRAVRADILAGKIDFASAAKAHSQCPTGPKGGDLGTIARKFQVDEALARTAFAMQPNQLSDVVETEAGFHLILVTERKPGKGSKFETVIGDVRECFEADLKQALLADLRKKGRIEVKR
jgi:parvulin-like peptidyl-prolyl isomerase